MSINHESSISGQSVGGDPKTSKRNSGLFSFLRWFKPSNSRESVNTDFQNSSTGSTESINSTHSTGTVASFSFVAPNEYQGVSERSIVPGPETDTYKARLKQRDKRREKDKNTTLRKKYNLFFNRDTLLKNVKADIEDNSKSLPLMTKKMENEKMHRRTNSESSKLKKAGAYCHVKGKRKAPQPPGRPVSSDGGSTISLRRKKRLAPLPPEVSPHKIINSLDNVEDTIEYADADVIYNDSLKLDHGILKPAKMNPLTLSASEKNITSNQSPEVSNRNSYVEAPVSPRPWYKRNANRDSMVTGPKREGESSKEFERLPEVPFTRNSHLDLSEQINDSHKENVLKLSSKPRESDIKIKDDQASTKEASKLVDKRKSGLMFLTNITELDKEASEIIKNERQSELNLQEMPAFMRPKPEQDLLDQETLSSPKRKSARDLIAKFNAITNVTKVTVNTAFFGSKDATKSKKDYFGRNLKITKEKTTNETKQVELVKNFSPIMKSESSNAIRPESEPRGTPKLKKKSWYCPKCSLENDYWRIICYVCSTIKPYFDDLTSSSSSKTSLVEIEKKTKPEEVEGTVKVERNFERAKTQIGFSALAKYNQNQGKDVKENEDTKKEEREKLKKMLIEMKNSLPKRKSKVVLSQNGRASIIDENVENGYEAAVATKEEEVAPKVEPVEEKTAEILVVKSETIYENIQVKKTENPKPIKVSSSVQTSAVVKKTSSENLPTGAIKKTDAKNLHLMRPKDFENIYNDQTKNTYANVGQDSMSLFFNMPKKFTDMKNNLNANNTDTLEVNRLLRRLETAIAKGELSEAAIFARELAQLKINCSVIRQKSEQAKSAEKLNSEFIVNLYVEDKISHRGPFPISVTESQTVNELKAQVEKELDIPVNIQRWILGKELAAKDDATLKEHNITTAGCPIFLYLVAPNEQKQELPVQKTEQEKPQDIEPEPGPSNKATTPSSNKEITPLVNKAATPPESKTTKIQIQPKLETQSNVKIQPKERTKKTPEKPDDPIQVKPKVQRQKSDFDVDYDTKTLTPNGDWICKVCTLINPVTNNVCSVCATVKQFSEQNVKTNTTKKKQTPKVQNEDLHYHELLNLDNADLVENMEGFECLICMTDIIPGEGVTLRECLHQFCKFCLAHTIEFSEEAQVKCPYRDNDYSCDIALQDREIKALVKPTVYESYLAKSVAQAENKSDKSFHCKTPDCKGWCIYEDNVNEFRCPVCRKMNCLTCQAIHTGLNCKQYQESVNTQSETNEDAKQTKQMLDEMVAKGEALICPTCHVVLMKKWGCDWVRCSMCKTEICWVTRGPRWGPAGKGDTSGGCKCGVNGMKCHPQCNYCH